MWLKMVNLAKLCGKMQSLIFRKVRAISHTDLPNPSDTRNKTLIALLYRLDICHNHETCSIKLLCSGTENNMY